MKTALIRFAAGIAIFLVLGTTTVAALEPGNITVAPAFLHVSVSKSKPVIEESIGIKNNFDTPVHLTAQLGGVDQQNTAFVPKDEADPILARAIRIETTDFNLLPRQSINLKLSVNNIEELAPGGHYASILIKQISTANQGIGFQPAVSVTMFIVKEDGAVRSLILNKPVFPRVAFGLPKKLILEFQNNGNVSLTPRASMSVSSGSTVYAKGVANEGSLPVLVGQTLKLETNLQRLSSAWLPNKYSLEVTYRYDGQDNGGSFSQNIWIVPPGFLILLGLISALLIRFRVKVKTALIKVLLIIQRFLRKFISVRPK